LSTRFDYLNLSVVCEACERRGCHRVERLIAEHGYAKLTDLLQTLADYPKARSFSVYDRCKASTVSGCRDSGS